MIRRQRDPGGVLRVFPAHAGMIRESVLSHAGTYVFPDGDDPGPPILRLSVVFPAHAGMIRPLQASP